MKDEHQIKAIIATHVSAMLEELGSSATPPGWIPEKAEKIVTNQVYGLFEYGNDVEEYMQKEGMLKDS